MNMRRRDFIRFGMAGSVLLAQAPSIAFAAAAPRRIVVWINLRGALDSLHAVVPAFDTALGAQRASLLAPLEDQLLALDGGYGLHPSLANLHAWYREGCFAPVVAVASPLRSRSHFAAQDVLECGITPAEHENGWLARALALYRGDALAVARSLPIVLRGPGRAQTWYPSNMPETQGDLHQRLMQLYADDAVLATRLREGMATRERIDMEGDGNRRPRFADLARSCGTLLAQNPAASCATLELSGWDTHNAQANRLKQQLLQLDEGLAALRQALGEHWAHTVVAVGTEFGRTVAVNGTGGTDHGTASALLLAGGALRGGRVLGDWPGLKPGDLFEGRDLRPTSDLRSWLAAALTQHWGLDGARVFPDIAPATVQLLPA
jgi:uncharacterized protein (DUF1501 family)